MQKINVLILIILLLTGCSSAAKHYRIYGDGPSFYKVLYKHVRDGQSLERVRAYLGPGEIVSDQEKTRTIFRKMMAKRPACCPKGVEDRDLFVQWQFDGHPFMTFQFRDNHLINYEHQDFETYEPFYSVK